MTTKFQLCTYQTEPEGEHRIGIAWIRTAFNVSDVEFIVDRVTGEKLESVYDYDLICGPLSFIDCDYRG